MAPSFIVTGMWGTTNLRLTLINSETGQILAEKQGPGISALSGQTPENALFALIAPWIDQYGVAGIYLSGMVGSTLGWIDAPYIECPIDISRVQTKLVQFDAGGIPVAIVPGLACKNPLGHPDVMRGEETELLAWFATATASQKQDSVVCIPGTHVKWVKVAFGRIESFMTSVTGEMYQVISKNGVLAKPHYGNRVKSSDAFLKALQDIENNPSNLMNLLFTTRANAVRAGFSDEDSTDYLSGLLIGADILSAIECYDLTATSVPIPLIGADYLVDRYALAFSHWGISVDKIKSADIAPRGLFSIYQQNPLHKMVG